MDGPVTSKVLCIAHHHCNTMWYSYFCGQCVEFSSIKRSRVGGLGKSEHISAKILCSCIQAHTYTRTRIVHFYCLPYLWRLYIWVVNSNLLLKNFVILPLFNIKLPPFALTKSHKISICVTLRTDCNNHQDVFKISKIWHFLILTAKGHLLKENTDIFSNV